jgi:hypothetical protein
MLVEARVVGESGARVAARELAGPGGGPVPARALIEHVVRAEVDAYADRERQRRFVRVLSPAEIDLGAINGRVRPGPRSPAPPPEPAEAVRVALQGFADGLYFLFVDDRQVLSLDEPVTVEPQSRVLFLRLTALAGG